MINDLEVDLTVDGKFSPRPIQHQDINVLQDQIDELENSFRLVRSIPWFSTPLVPQIPKKEKYPGDILSNEMNCLVRRTSDGGWFFTGNDDILNKEWFDQLFEEVLYETLGIYKLKKCIRCGKELINIEPYGVCDECKLSIKAEKTLQKLN